METLGLNGLQAAFQGRRILVTGHTGFKGSWLCKWLLLLGAEVKGYSLPPETSPNHFDLLALPIDSTFGDIRDREALSKAVATFQPDFIFHLAAQALVKRSYSNAQETFSTNVMGLVNLLDSALACESVQGVLNVTSDKCYENRGVSTGYLESDPMGGHDPYSASKGCAELLTSSYRRSFFEPRGKLLASARAGNVVGGGDWSPDRLVPDVVRAIVAGQPVHVRRPAATRPWQHVLDPLRGYLLLARQLLDGNADAATGWNFGPAQCDGGSVREVLQYMTSRWPAFKVQYMPEEADFHEAELLHLDSSRAKQGLGWQPLLDIPAAFALTMDWYREFHEHATVQTEQQILAYTSQLPDVGTSTC